MFRLVYWLASFFTAEPIDQRDRGMESFPAMISDLEWVGEAIVTQTIAPGREGQVKFRGSWWTARHNLAVVLQPGDRVLVRGRHNLTLYVEPLALRELAIVIVVQGDIQPPWGYEDRGSGRGCCVGHATCPRLYQRQLPPG